MKNENVYDFIEELIERCNNYNEALSDYRNGRGEASECIPVLYNAEGAIHALVYVIQKITNKTIMLNYSNKIELEDDMLKLLNHTAFIIYIETELFGAYTNIYTEKGKHG